MAESYADALKDEGFAPNTYNKHVGFLRLFFDVLRESARIEENPYEKIKHRKLQTQSRRELTVAELKTVLGKADGELKTLLMLGTFTNPIPVCLDQCLIRRGHMKST